MLNPILRTDRCHLFVARECRRADICKICSSLKGKLLRSFPFRENNNKVALFAQSYQLQN